MPRISEELRYHVKLKMKEEINQKKVARDLNMFRCTVRNKGENIALQSLPKNKSCNNEDDRRNYIHSS